MFVDSTAFPPGHTEQAQICIFGSGPAGMTLAHSLAEAGRDVILIEAGGEYYEDGSQKLYEGAVKGDPYFNLSEARLRYFGGTSGHWGGTCRPLDPRDFMARPNQPLTQWPIGAEDLKPYLAPASEILEISPDFRNAEVVPGLIRQDFHFSPPVQFGEKYFSYCETAQNLRVCLNSAMVNLHPRDGDAAAVGRADIITEKGEGGEEGRIPWQVQADIFILCLGGIENSRMLAWVNEQNERRLIPNHDLIGRYWMEHPNTLVAEGVLFRKGEKLLEQISSLTPGWRDQGAELNLGLSAKQQEENETLNVNFLFLEEAYDRSKQLMADLLCVAPGLGRWIAAAGDRELVCGARVQAMWEQNPDPQNRVSLGSTKDRLGIPQVELHWRKSDTDRAAIAKSCHEFARLFAEYDLGRIRLSDWVVDESLPMSHNPGRPAHYHHMGGTRMSNSPDTGIVDADMKVHGVDNLYIAGSSVFASGGYANPTLTIVQLSLRLADHIGKRLGH